MNTGAWRATVHGVAKSGTRLSDLERAHSGKYSERQFPTSSKILNLIPVYFKKKYSTKKMEIT